MLKTVLGFYFAVLLTAVPAFAHSIVGMAYVDGNVIEGEIGFSNGDMAKNVAVRVFDKDGAEIGQTTTDGDGLFRFETMKVMTYVFKADLGQGHVAEIVVPAEDLGGVGQGKAPAMPQETTATADMQALIAKTVAQQIRPLQRQIFDYENKVRMHDILGGLGYILGLFGLFFYMKAKREK